MTEALVVSTAPIFRVDGMIKGELARDLLRLEIEETTAGLKTLAARLIAQGGDGGTTQARQLYLDGSIIDFGKKLEVSIGSSEEARTIFTGWVSGLEAVFAETKEPEVGVFAEDKLMKLRMTRRSKTYEQMSDADIASALASEHGLTPEVDAAGPTYDVVQQWNMSDLAFLRQRARLIQAELWVDGEKLCFKSRGARNGTALTLVQDRDLLETRVRADLAHQRTSVKVSGYDVSQGNRIDEAAGPDAITAEAGPGLSGPALLQRAFGERVSRRVRQVPLVSDEATQWARAEMLRRARGFVTVTATTRGTPDMVVGSKVTLQRVGKPFEGEGYYVTRVCHTYDLESGFRTRFEAERATIKEGS